MATFQNSVRSSSPRIVRTLGRPVLLILLLLAFISAHAADRASSPVVHTPEGSVTGISQDGVLVFKGIPFAKPPVGNLRWKPPQPVSAWNGVLKADHFSPACMQERIGSMLPWTEPFMVQGPMSEDCLYLNVWTSSTRPAQPMPVYVYIYGGAFQQGATSVAVYDGANIAKKNVVFVSLNYRVGVFGFLADSQLTKESPHHSSGNYGLLDQIAGLHWVQKNIAAFGGDPHNITIAGQSAGAMSVVDLLVSPLAHGLFHAAIAESGVFLADLPLQSLQNAEKAGADYALQHGAKSLAELRSMPADKLLAHPLPRFSPITDGWVLPKSPQDAISAGAIANVPMITGLNADEGSMSPKYGRVPASEFKSQAAKTYGDLAAAFLKLYPAGNDTDAHESEVESARDREKMATWLWGLQRSKHTTAPLYTYVFTRRTPWPEHPEFGAFHSSELPYVFMVFPVVGHPYTSEDRHLSEVMNAYWMAFASKHNPNGDTRPHWPAFSPGSFETMDFGDHVGPVPIASPAKIAFWRKYFASPQGAHASPF